MTSHSPNPNKFVKIMCNVVFGYPLHLRIIGLEGDTSLVFVKKKLDGNSHIPNKGIFTLHILMKNCSLALMCESSNPLCIPPFALHASVRDNIHNNSHEGISMAITTSQHPLHSLDNFTIITIHKTSKSF